MAEAGTLRRVVERVVEILDGGMAGVPEARAWITEAGVEPGAMTGTTLKAEDFDEAMTYQWVLGQFASVIDNEAWFAMNAGLNVAHHQLDKYAGVS